MQGFGIPTIFLIAGAALVAAIACIVLACRVSGRLRRSGLLLLSLVLLVPPGFLAVVLKPELIDARIRTFKRLYDDVEVGMDRSDVEQLVVRHYPPGGPRVEPGILEDTTSRLIYRMTPEHSRHPNCEDFILQMRDGRVVAKSYSRD